MAGSNEQAAQASEGWQERVGDKMFHRNIYEPDERKFIDALLAMPKDVRFWMDQVAAKAGVQSFRFGQFVFGAFASSQEGKRRPDGCGLVHYQGNGKGGYEWKLPDDRWQDWIIPEDAAGNPQYMKPAKEMSFRLIGKYNGEKFTETIVGKDAADARATEWRKKSVIVRVEEI